MMKSEIESLAVSYEQPFGNGALFLLLGIDHSLQEAVRRSPACTERRARNILMLAYA